jgi:hypothetical protein
MTVPKSGRPSSDALVAAIEGSLIQEASLVEKSENYSTGSLQFSSVSFTLWRNWWAIAPSTTR